MHQESTVPLIGRDIPWRSIQGEFCRVLYFLPMGTVEGGKVKALTGLAYASLRVESPTLPVEQAFLPVKHRLDFRACWEVFEERGVKDTEEVLVSYVPPKRGFIRLVSWFLPKLHLFIYPKGRLEEWYDPDFSAEHPEEWMMPIAEWHPNWWRRYGR